MLNTIRRDYAVSGMAYVIRIGGAIYRFCGGGDNPLNITNRIMYFLADMMDNGRLKQAERDQLADRFYELNLAYVRQLAQRDILEFSRE